MEHHSIITNRVHLKVQWGLSVMGTMESVSRGTQPLGTGSTGLRIQDTWRGVQKCFNFFEGQKKKK